MRNRQKGAIRNESRRNVLQGHTRISAIKCTKKLLTQERDKINAQLEVIEDVLIDLNDILCKHGNHIYEHFVETDPQAESEE